MTETVRILILEDVPSDAELMVGVLRKENLQFEWQRVETREAFLEQLQTGPDVILADIDLPGFDGLSALKLVRTREPNIPFILVSGTIAEDVAVAAIRDGADDFILKDRMGRLAAAVVQAIERRRLRMEAVQAEEAQRESELRFHQISENIRQVFWLTDPGKNLVLYISPAYEEIWGRKSEALYQSPHSWADALHPADRERVLEAGREKQKRGDYAEEYRIIRPDGSVRWILDRAFPVRDEGGHVYRIAGLAEDITARKHSQQRLQAQCDVARALSEAATFAEAVPRILEAVARNLEFQTAVLWEVAPQAGELVCLDTWHDGSEALQSVVASSRKLKIRPGYGTAGRAWETAKPFWIPDAVELATFTSAPAEAQARFKSAGLHGAVAFPIVLHGTVRGVADFFSTEILEPDQALLETLGAIGSQIGQFLDRRRQQENIERLNRIYAVLSGINSAIVRIRDRAELFQESCRISVESGGFAVALVGLLDPDSLDVKPVASRGEEQDLDLFLTANYSARDDVVGGQGTVGNAIRTGTLSYCNDLRRETNLGVARKEAMRRGYRSLASLPLFTAGKCIGVLVLYSKDADWFDEPELKLLIELAKDISYALDFIENEERVTRLAYRDPLTGLPNRTSLHNRIKEFVLAAKGRQHPFAVLLMNINNFRDINDTLGHYNGDVFLNEVARRVSSALWESDLVACLGGDEFALLLDHLTDKSDIDVVISKLTGVLKEPISIMGLPINVEVRLGIAIYPDHGDTADLLWQHADIALRAAKSLHEGQVIYRSEIDHYNPDRLALIGGLRDAIDNDDLVLHFQPQIEVASGQTVGVEALLRWKHETRGLLGPDAFVPLVERTSLINPLTTWVMADAMRQQRKWSEQGLALRMAVNVSARNLQNPELAGEIIALAEESGFPLTALTIEITESAIMIDPARAFDLLGELHGTGMRIAMDDFGTGQSSLAYIRDLPIDEIKIDKSFVMDLGKGRNAAIVHSAVELGHQLELLVTAEGVEDGQALEAIRRMGCDLAQGYYFSKPLPATELTAWLRGSRPGRRTER